MSLELAHAFDEIGALLADDTVGRRFEIDIVMREQREAYLFQYPLDDLLTLEIVDVHRRLRHLVLDVTGWRLPISGRYLCGHDESHWFVAGLGFDRKSATVRGAMESLKPEIVRREQRRKGVKHRRNRRKTAAYLRQGEWFFLPRPKMHVVESLVVHDSQLVRGNGKPHWVDHMYLPPGRDEIFVRGRVRHSDHETISLHDWHRVVQNNEVDPSQVNGASAATQHIAWLD